METEISLNLDGILYRRVEHASDGRTCDDCDLQGTCEWDGGLSEFCKASDLLCDSNGLFKKEGTDNGKTDNR